MKLAVLGGGGFRTPFVWQALLRDTGTPRVDHVVLQDSDPARLEAMRLVLGQLAAPFPDAPRLETTTVLDEAVEGSDGVFAAVRVGGLEGRCADERVALDLGVLGQETTGPGGIAYGLRTVPFMVHVAERVKALARRRRSSTSPTRPASSPRRCRRSSATRSSASATPRPVSVAASRSPSATTRTGRSWTTSGSTTSAGCAGSSSTAVTSCPTCSATSGSSPTSRRATSSARPAAAARVVPNEYLYYYYRNREAVSAILASGETRGEFLRRTQGDFFDRVRAAGPDAADLWRTTVLDRSASYMAEAKGGEQGAPLHPEPPETDPSQQGYAGVALAVLTAVSRDQRAPMILNVRNGTRSPASRPTRSSRCRSPSVPRVRSRTRCRRPACTSSVSCSRSSSRAARHRRRAAPRP